MESFLKEFMKELQSALNAIDNNDEKVESKDESYLYSLSEERVDNKVVKRDEEEWVDGKKTLDLHETVKRPKCENKCNSDECKCAKNKVDDKGALFAPYEIDDNDGICCGNYYVFDNNAHKSTSVKEFTKSNKELVKDYANLKNKVENLEQTIKKLEETNRRYFEEIGSLTEKNKILWEENTVLTHKIKSIQDALN